MTIPVRTLVVWCADWPVAAGDPPDQPVAVCRANQVVATSPGARAEGVMVGLRRREAQARCPQLLVRDHDPARDARAFEPVVAALATLTPRVEVTEPGRCAFPTRGPSRYFGGDAALAARAVALAADVLGGRGRASAGVADGPLAATLAAQAAAPTYVVPPGATPEFLAPLPLSTLGVERAELVDVLRRLGLRTLGDFAALPAADVVARFGTEGALAHRLASGLDEHPPATCAPPLDLAVQTELDPPVERVEAAAFAARALADELHAGLSGRGLACTRVLIVAETEHGEHHERRWRHEGTLTAAAIVDRVRWQLDGWLNARDRPTAGITVLRLVPDEVVPARGRQLGFWGGATAADERAIRALARIEGMLGPEAVTVPERRGGRSPGERVALVPAGAVDLTDDRPRARPEGVDHPWPGRVPDPSPAAVHRRPLPAEVVAAHGELVGVSGRGVPTATPAQLRVGEQTRWSSIVAWAGPWLADERWWDPARRRRRARFQVVTDDGTARLLAIEGGQWWVEATYD